MRYVMMGGTYRPAEINGETPMSRIACLAILALTACAGEGEVNPSDPQVGQTDLGRPTPTDTGTDGTNDTNTDTVDTTTDIDTAADTTDTGTGYVPPADELVVTADRVGLTIEVTIQTDGVAGPWTITVDGTHTLVTVDDLASWDLAEAEGVWVTDYDPCTDLGTIVTIEATDGTLYGTYDLDLVGSIVAVTDTGPSADGLDLTGLATPIAMCGSATADQFDLDAWNVFGLPVADWRVDVIAQGNLDIDPIDPNSLEPDCYATFAATGSFNFSVSADAQAGAGVVSFDVLIDEV